MQLNLSRHAKIRMDERIPPDISKTELSNAIKDNSKIKYIKRLTQTRSLAYVYLSNGIVKVVVSKKQNKVITVYPWESDYEVTVNIPINDDSFYVIRFYPDCWIETKTARPLTDIVKITKTGFENIVFLHPDFNHLFTQAFNLYNQYCETNIYEDKKTKAKIIQIKNFLGDTKIFSEKIQEYN